MNRKIVKFKEIFEEKKAELLNSLKKETEIDVSGDEVDAIQGKIIANTERQLFDRARVQLRIINIALKKIEGGSFGTCDECGELIPQKRLLAKPEAGTCICCAEKLEKLAKQFK